MDEPLSIVLFSGTDDRLTAASVFAAGAAVLGRPVHILLQYWGLEAFRADRIGHARGLSVDASADGTAHFAAAIEAGQVNWAETLRQSKELGEVEIHACSQSMDVLKLEPADLDPLVDGVEGIAGFLVAAGDGQLLFI
jgi:peroxiredoxin family protein